ncbi:hypothetical protein FWK35_00030687, partial [Aphis craccivora]
MDSESDSGSGNNFFEAVQ